MNQLRRYKVFYLGKGGKYKTAITPLVINKKEGLQSLYHLYDDFSEERIQRIEICRTFTVTVQ